MQNFEYCVPTKVVFGRDTESRCGELVRECGGTHALVVYGGGSAVRSGLLGRCTDSLKAAGIPYELLGGVQPNPRLSRVREGIALAKETGADFLLAVGGGSVIDTAKAIGYALANPEFDIWDLFMGKATAKACAPVGAVLSDLRRRAARRATPASSPTRTAGSKRASTTNAPARALPL